MSSLALAQGAPALAGTLVRTVRNVTAQAVQQATTGAVTAVLSPTMQQALTNQMNNQARIATMQTMIQSAQAAAVTAAKNAATASSVPNGIASGGLQPIAGVINLVTSGVIATSNLATAQAAPQGSTVVWTGSAASVPTISGVTVTTSFAQIAGKAVPSSFSAASDASGTATWDGANAPVQGQDSSTGAVTVSITQTNPRALLSWTSFNVGASTTLLFNQSVGGVAQTGWTVVNRVVNSIAPSTILGSIQAPGTVVVLNSQGVLFGATSQVNTQSLLVSTLELGPGYITSNGQDYLATLQQRNTAFLQNGLFAAVSNGQAFLSPNYAAPILAAGGSLALVSATPWTPTSYQSVPLEGGVVLDLGSQITAGDSGYVIVAAPSINSSAIISATDGQVSLQGGRQIYVTQSTGGAGSVDPNVRGYLLRSFLDGRDDPEAPPVPDGEDGFVVNDGLIESKRGYISLGTGMSGTVVNSGLLLATTSTSRNGAIDLYGGTVTLTGNTTPGLASAVAILPDEDGETLPQGSAAEFLSSAITIGTYVGNDTPSGDVPADLLGTLSPGQFTMGGNALVYAPNASVVVGRGAATVDPLVSQLASGITIASGADIDVSGLKDVALAMSTNSVEISPVTANDLADTPNYRLPSTSTNGAFTLNGATLYIDQRISGVRSDGVAWVGSPLLDAGAIVAQVPDHIDQLMTGGGSVTLAVGGLSGASSAAAAPHIAIASGATIDISGGWVDYAAGTVEASNLITADGRLVPISDADPNATYIGVANGYTASSPAFGVNSTYSNTLFQGSTVEPGYTQGSDAGTLVITAPAIALAGTINGQAFAGALQIAQGNVASTVTAFGSSYRLTQATPYQLPAGGAVQIGSFTGGSQPGLGADIVVYDGTLSDTGATSFVQTLLSDTMLDAAGLSSLSLQTSGAVLFAGGTETLLDPTAATLAGASNLTLAPGGVLDVEAGRSITFDGTISAPSGAVIARTLQLGVVTNANGLSPAIAAIGSPFTSTDDIPGDYASLSAAARPYDITVNGTISTAGLFTNDLLVTDGLYQGPAYINGGAISLTVAPSVFVPISIDGGTTVTDYADLSGSITVAKSALLDVSAGAYVAPTGVVTTTARGGSVSLIDQTIFAPLLSFYPPDGSPDSIKYALPSVEHSGVFVNEGSLKGFGFVGAGSGTFTLDAPNIGFGSDTIANGSNIPLDFFAATGFGALNLTSLRTVTVAGLFTGDASTYAFLATTDFTIHSGETLDLSQSLFSNQLSETQLNALRALPSGGVLTQVLTPAIPTNPWDQIAANLTLGGLTELDIDAGGTLTGAAQAQMTVPKLDNAGTIILPGGTITQQQSLPVFLAEGGVGIQADTAGFTSVFGAPAADGTFSGSASSPVGMTYQNTSNQPVPFTNLLTVQYGNIYELGTLSQNVGIQLAAGSVTNLAGTVVFDPYAGFMAGGTQIITGRLIGGGTITAAAANETSRAYFATPTYAMPAENINNDAVVNADLFVANVGLGLQALPGSTINLAGASATFDVAQSATTYAPALQWSNGGTIAALGGGAIAGATINAVGGASAASGGTLEWLNPTITDTVTGTGADQLLDTQIEASGFDTLVSLGHLTLSGNVALTLRNALFVEGAPAINAAEAQPSPAEALVVSATADTVAAITAPYIRFSSTLGAAPNTDTPFIGQDLAPTGNATVTFNAGSLGLDVVGAVVFDGTIAATTLNSAADLRLIGTPTLVTSSQFKIAALNGELLTDGDLTIDAARTYATTGTGNLQQILENLAAGTPLVVGVDPFEIAAYGNSTIMLAGDHSNDSTPLSAGSYLRIQAANIVQDGYLAAPLGVLELGGNGTASILGTAVAGTSVRAIATQSITFGAGSITNVSGADVTVGGVGTAIPYGTTVDLTSYYFSPTESNAITVAPTGQFLVAAKAITVAPGATLDGNGGGDAYAYEFVAGTGGSHNVLSQTNSDPYTSDNYNSALGEGTQYPDGRQVYAIVPADHVDSLAFYDPVYSAGYSNLYTTNVGETVHLDGGQGIAAGNYVLLPAQYATLAGAYRLVENTGSAAPYVGAATTLLDGSIVMGGTLGAAATGQSGSARLSFTIDPQATIYQYSTIQTTSLTTQIQSQAAVAGITNPALPLDAARLVLSPTASLDIAGTFDLTAATGGQGTKIDISDSDIVIGATDPGVAGALFLSNSTLADLDANSLFIGGVRQQNANGTTTLDITASSITVDKDAALSGPEILLATAAKDPFATPGPALTIASGASITATGTLSNTGSGDYIIPADTTPSASDTYAMTGISAALLVSTGPQRLFQTQGSYATRAGDVAAKLNIGAATISGADIALESTRTFTISNAAKLSATNIAVTGDNLTLGGAAINTAIVAKLAAAANLTLRSPDLIRFANGTYDFNNLTLDTPGIAKLAATPKQRSAVGGVTINTDTLDWYASEGSFTGCAATGALSCGVAGSTLAINASGAITFGAGTLGVTGFNTQSAVTLAAMKGIYIAGTGSLSIANQSALASDASSLSIVAPFIADTSAIADPANQATPPSYAFTTLGAFSLTAPTLAANATAAVPTGNRAPGASITIGSLAAPVASATIDGAAIIATAGTIAIYSQGDITLAGAAALEVPGYTKTFGDALDATTVSAGGGTLALTSLAGNITLPTTATLITDTGVGNAGALNLLAAEGAIDLGATINPGVTGARAGSFTYDAQNSSFDLGGFVTTYGNLFEGDISIRAGLGNLTLNAGQTLTATGVTLTADDTATGLGQITIAGTIDTAGQSVAGLTLAQTENLGVDGGDIALYGNNGLTLAGTAMLDTQTSGYLDSDTRSATAGDVTLGIASQSAALTIDAGAAINVGANRLSGQSGNRLVAQTVSNPQTLTPETVYDFVQADSGGTVTLRAPVDDATSSHVNIVLPAALPVRGAASIQIVGFKTYDLDTLATRHDISGIKAHAGTVTLNLTTEAPPAGPGRNLLADSFVASDGLESVPYFIQNFDITAADGSAFSNAITQRPGVVLETTGNLTLGSNWNLAAGNIDFAKAVADGNATSYKMNDKTYYAVVPGQEAALLADDVQMIYRVGTGDGNIANAAPVISLIAGKTLTTNYSISDGLFTFRDTTNPDYTNLELGGGDRTVLPAGTFGCVIVANCNNPANPGFNDTAFYQVGESLATGSFDPSTALLVNLSTLGAGADVTTFTAPLTQQANSVAFALPSGKLVGDPESAAEVFPLLDDGTAYAASSSLQLVGGAGAALSANPLHVDRGSGGSVVVQGEGTYTLSSAKGHDKYVTAADGVPTLSLDYTSLSGVLANGNSVAVKDSYIVDSDLLDTINSDPNLNQTIGTLSGSEYTVLKFGSGTGPEADYLRAAAAKYFTYVNDETYNFAAYGNLTTAQQLALHVGIAQGAAKTPSGVAAPLDEIVQFLDTINPKNGLTIAETVAKGVISGAYSAAPPSTALGTNLGIYKQVSYASLIRTGDGTIDVAAARDVTLAPSTVTYNAIEPAPTTGPVLSSANVKYQQGGAAIYTVGHLALDTPVTAATVDGSVALTLDFGQEQENTSYLTGTYIPSALQESVIEPDLLTGGGSITLSAGGDITGRRNAWAQAASANTVPVNKDQATLASRIGASNQLWRPGTVGDDTLIGISADLFTSGVGALGGGNITIKAGGNATELTVADDTSVVTANNASAWTSTTFDRFATLTSVISGTATASAPVMATLGGGNVELSAGGNLYGSQVDIASGQGTITVGGSILNATTPLVHGSVSLDAFYLPDAFNLRVADSSVTLNAAGSVQMNGISALGAYTQVGGAEPLSSFNQQGFFTAIAGLNLSAGGSVSLQADAQADPSVSDPFEYTTNQPDKLSSVVTAPTLAIAALSGDILLGTAGNVAGSGSEAVPYLLYASPIGQLSLLAGGSINQLSVAMLDSDPSLLPGAFTTYNTITPTNTLTSTGSNPIFTANNLGFTYPGYSPAASLEELRLLHSESILHLDDTAPVRIFADGSLTNSNIVLAKQARIGAGQDIVNLYFVGQNVAATDITRITAGRDITGTIATDRSESNGAGGNKQFVVGNSFVLGGPGELDVEAGRNLGPFVSSGVVNGVAYAGGIRTIGNEADPWLGTAGADVSVLFGVANGIDYSALRETYLDPANFANLYGADFVQQTDTFGNDSPIRSESIFAPLLAQWFETNQPTAFATVFAGVPVSTSAELTAASYTHYDALYAAFANLSILEQSKFLIPDVYFTVLASVANPSSIDYHQYFQGYQAVQTLFPASLGYTDNLSAYTIDPATASAEYPLGLPVRNLVGGVSVAVPRVQTGNADLRLATIETDEGGNVDILGPGGNFIAGSVIRTSVEVTLKATTASNYATGSTAALNQSSGTSTPYLSPEPFTAVPLGYEGVITLRGGAIDSFSDGDLLLNQSRVFTLGGGDITMWSSNGDLNAGAGPVTSADYPPVTVEFSLDGTEQVNSASSVTGAGIGTFQSSPSDPASSVTLIAPVGTVDAGAAGVRASGNVIVAAARVLNADNFKAGGTITGVPSASPLAAPVTPAAAASALVANIARIAESNTLDNNQTIITVEVTNDACPNGDDRKDDGTCDQ